MKFFSMDRGTGENIKTLILVFLLLSYIVMEVWYHFVLGNRWPG